MCRRTSNCFNNILRPQLHPTLLLSRQYASLSAPPIKHHPPTQPPSFKAATSQKTYLHRLYLSLIRSSPSLLLLQHNSVTAQEWMAIRRELNAALVKLDSRNPEQTPLARLIHITTIQAPIFSVALRVADYNGEAGVSIDSDGDVIPFSYGTSEEARNTTKKMKRKHPLTPVLRGPTSVVSFPSISPDHITTTIDVLFPQKAILRKGADPVSFSGMQKLTLLAARVKERQFGMSRVLDNKGIKYVAGLEDLETMRGKILAILRNVGGGELVRSLEGVGIGLGRTLEGRRKMLEEEQAGPAGDAPKAE